jgi:hypothetical protein
MWTLDMFAVAERKARAQAEPSIPFVHGSETSREAAVSMVRPATRLRLEVLKFIENEGERGATADEVQLGLGLTHQTGSARVSELAHGGQIVDSGLRRATRSGRSAVVYRAAAAGGDHANGI